MDNLAVTKQFVLYGNERLEFTRVPRKTESARVMIQVNPDCSIIVIAPEPATNQEVERAVVKRARWISIQLQKFEQQNAFVLPRTYVSGESHFYLGKRYLLKINRNRTAVQGVKLLRGKIEVNVRTSSPEKTKALLQDWYKDKAREVFNVRLEVLLEKTPWVSEKPHIRIMRMATQWGSCSPSGLLTLNPHLVKASRECIDYVLLHELCHLAEHNHSERFYRLMNQVMPKWADIKAFLDNNANRYINI
jgi:predicted metal-dependent hydrolase